MVSHHKVNDGFIYLDFENNIINQMHCVYYPEQDTWYIYGFLTHKTDIDYVKHTDVDQITDREMNILLSLIDQGLTIVEFLTILIETGREGHYRSNVFYCDEIMKQHLDIDYLCSLPDPMKETVKFEKYLPKIRENKINQLLDETTL